MIDQKTANKIQKKAQLILTITGVLLGLLLNAVSKYNVDNATISSYPMNTDLAIFTTELFAFLSILFMITSFCISLALVFDSPIYTEATDPEKMLHRSVQLFLFGIILGSTAVVILVFNTMLAGVLFPLSFAYLIIPFANFSKNRRRIANKEDFGNFLFYFIYGFTILALIFNIELNSLITSIEFFILFFLLLVYKYFMIDI